MSVEPCILIVPGLRDAVAQHWQSLLEARLRATGRAVAAVHPMGREDLDCATRVAAISPDQSGPVCGVCDLNTPRATVRTRERSV